MPARRIRAQLQSLTAICSTPFRYAIIHLDGDRLNNRIDNLVLLDKKEIGKMSHNKLDYDAETNSMIVARVKLESAIERKGK